LKKKSCVFLLTLILLLMPLLDVNAATKYQGYTLYRDKYITGLSWHAGLFYGEDASDNLPIVHIKGYFGQVRRVPYDTGDENFLAGATFKGVYLKSGVTSTQLTNIRNLGYDLTTEGISYCDFYMLEENTNDYWIYPEDVVEMRCDGVVEYCYEYYGIKLQYYIDEFTYEEHWDIDLCNNAKQNITMFHHFW
jgi:hypothetical protein